MNFLKANKAWFIAGAVLVGIYLVSEAGQGVEQGVEQSTSTLLTGGVLIAVVAAIFLL